MSKTIGNMTLKASPVGTDMVAIADSEDSDKTKKVLISAISGGGGGGTVARTVYVDAVNGSDNNTGTVNDPYKTIRAAILSNADMILVQPNTPATAFTNFQVSNRTKPFTVMLATDAYTASEPEKKIYVSGTASPYHGVRFTNCKGVSLYDFYVTNIGRHGIFFDDCGYGECTRCIVDTNTTADFCGFRADNTDVKYYNCIARNITLDGFNFHYNGDSVLVNCKAYNCGDDGVSHHNNSSGIIIGGEFYNCGKGGISSPTYGAKVDIISSYSHDNTQYGLYADGGASGSYSQAQCTAINCRFENNTTADFYTKNCKLTFIDTYYRTRSIVSDNTNFIEKRNEQFVDTTSTSPLTLKANTVYKLGTISSLEISNFIDDVREIEIQFTTDSTFTFTDGGYTGKWLGVSTPSFDPSTSYVIAIKNGYAVLGKVGA